MLLEQYLKQPKNPIIWKLSSQHLNFITRELKYPHPQCVVLEHQPPHLEDWDFILFMSYQQWQTSQGFFQIFPKNLHTLSSNNLFVLFILVLKKRIYTLAKSSVLVHSSTVQCWAAEEHGRDQWSAAAPISDCLCSVFAHFSPPAPLPSDGPCSPAEVGRVWGNLLKAEKGTKKEHILEKSKQQ